MDGLPLRAALRRSLARIVHIAPVPPDRADGLVARVYRQVERDFGMLAPPVALHSPAPEPLAASWMMLRETLLADGVVPRAAKEAVAAAVSLDNTCPYCVTVHGATLHGLAGRATATAVTGDRIGSVADPVVRSAAAWARASGTAAAARRRAPMPAELIPELLGVATTFQYLNRMVNVFLGRSPLPFGVPAVARAGMTRLLGRYLRGTARAVHRPGAAVDLLPAAPLPADLRWATGSPHIATAFARASAAIDTAGRRSVPEPVRDLVSARLAVWDGRPPGPSRSWVQDATGDLPAGHRPAGRLALLTALASYQVDQSVVEEFRRDRHGDQNLVEVVSWASMAAARRAATWAGLDPPPIRDAHADQPSAD